MCKNCLLNRREFVETIGILAAGAGTLLTAGAVFADTAPNPATFQWNPDAPMIHPCKTLRVQPVLMCVEQPFSPKNSFRNWGAVNTKKAIEEEKIRIAEELVQLKASAEFAVEFLPLITVSTTDEAKQIHEQDYDVVLVYAASGVHYLFEACVAPDPTKDTIIFVRHLNGPFYQGYQALDTWRYVKPTTAPELAGNSAENHGPMTTEDVVVDKQEEIVWRLRSLFALKNFIGHKTITIGGASGKWAADAPHNCKTRFKHEIVDVTYAEFEKRYREYLAVPEIVAKAEAWTDIFLNMPNTKLETKREFVVRAFIVYGVFKELLIAHQATTLTVLGCMGTMFHAAETTACLSLGWLNDEGYLGLCESDFVLVPAAILMRHITNKPVFMTNSTFPHDGMATCAHCASPRRMDGVRYEPMRIRTHYESEFGASPKVDYPVGQQVTLISPHFNNPRWLAFTGTVLDNPDFPICRSQQDVSLDGNWKLLKNEARNSHWTMSYGDYKNEVEYLSRKIGMQCVRID